MEKELYARVSRWFEEHRDEMVRDIMRLVRIGSVSKPDSEEKPFGQGCRECLDEMLAIGREHGFCTENYDYYVGSIGEAAKQWDNMIGFWNHLDVVPVGTNWEYKPFEPEYQEPFLFGRGSQDNKGPAVGMLYVMQCIRELQIPMEHELRLFVGCDEERGMEDLAWYAKHHPLPKLSMVADSGFPVCYGEKGILEGKMLVQRPFSEAVAECAGGSASNMVPALAWVKFRTDPALAKELAERLGGKENSVVTCEEAEDGMIVRATGTARHSAFPEGSINAVYELMRFLAALESLSGQDAGIFRQLAHCAQGVYGENLGIDYSDQVSGRTTCVATVLETENGHASLHYNIRYAITHDAKKLEEGLCRAAVEHEMRWETVRNSAPSYFPKEHPAVKLLTDLYNEITGEARESFTMGGGTYARKLPNAFAYGPGGMAETDGEKRIRQRLLKPGHGGAHEPDECLNVRQLLDALKIYVMALAELNWCPL